MNLANKITLSRIVLGPLIFGSIVFGVKILAFFFILCNFLLDWLDGFLARKCKKMTKFGEFIDPLTDAFIFIFTCFGFYLIGIKEINWAFLPIILIILSFFLGYFRKEKFEILHTKTKYIHTPFLYLSFIFILFEINFWEIFFAIFIVLFTASHFELFLRSLRKFLRERYKN